MVLEVAMDDTYRVLLFNFGFTYLPSLNIFIYYNYDFFTIT